MYYLAIDIGASSGRHILGEMKNGRLETTEVYRFENGFKEQNGTLIWDIDYQKNTNFKILSLKNLCAVVY